jgi:nucleoside-diphosphate-sugar epimerase
LTKSTGIEKIPVMNVLITGAAGNLGSLLADHLVENTSHALHLMIHKKDVKPEMRQNERVRVFQADLADSDTLHPALTNVDVVVHFAGVLFKARPEKFLPTTNIRYFQNLVNIAVEKQVRRIILISFPHVEGETSVQHPAAGRLDHHPTSVHAQTRLEEERYLFQKCQEHGFESVSLRVGMVYGKGILMVDTARWLAKHWLLGVWTSPTWIHLISTPDFLVATTAAVEKDDVEGIYHLGDEGVQTLQQFLDIACGQWQIKKPWRMPIWMIYTASVACEMASAVFKVPAPLTRDFITIGRQSYYGDTGRMRRELLPELQYPTLDNGKKLLL